MTATQDDTIAELQRTIWELRRERDTALERETALAEVLEVINRSPSDALPVFDMILEKAHRLCGADLGAMITYDGVAVQTVVSRGYSEAAAALVRGPSPPSPAQQTLIAGERYRHIPDVRAVEIGPDQGFAGGIAEITGLRTFLMVPLRKDGTVRGFFTAHRLEVRPFSEQDIALLESFAAQAVIAMENARLLTEQREALEQQTATAEVLQVINASPGDLNPVFDAILKKAHILCGAEYGVLLTYDGEVFWPAAVHGDRLANSETFRRGLRPGFGFTKLIRGERLLHIHDMAKLAAEMPDDPVPRALFEISGIRTQLAVPLRRDGKLLGIITANRREVRPFVEKEIALIENFAAQAVIAMENARLITETREALEQQTATAEVLQVINANPGDLTPVFDAILDKAHTLCGAVIGSLVLFDGTHFRAVATHGFPEQVASLMRHPVPPNSRTQELIDGMRFRQIEDIRATRINGDYLIMRALVEYTDMRTVLFVPLRKDGALRGFISAYRPEVRAFSDKEIALLENFAAQAVIATENARLLTEQREALEQQTATAEVLQVINASPGNLAPVFDAVLEKAIRLCDSAFGMLATYDGHIMRYVAVFGLTPEQEAVLSNRPLAAGQPTGRIGDGENVVHLLDARDQEGYRAGFGPTRNFVDRVGARTAMWVALRKDKELLGLLTIFRREVRAFTDKEIALVQNFAAQAVIAMENARLLNEVRQRQEELRITFENIGDGVAMFDETQHLIAWNRKFQDILDVPDDIIARRQTFSEYVHYLAERGEYDPGADPKEHVRRLIEQAGQSRTYERTRPDGQVIEIRHNTVAGGGFVLIYADITERKRNEAAMRAARDAAEEASRTIEAAYSDLKAAQTRLIQAEKMASLGQLTAGIAHEIKNPLNFVNNFSDLSVDLLNELREAVAPGKLAVADGLRAEIDDITTTLKGNLEKIAEHGRRADSIVKNMLQHSRTGPSEQRAIDVNATVEEALNLAYHGARAETPGFNITMEKDLDPKAGSVDAFPQEFLRVMLNLISNGFYAARKRANAIEDKSFKPTLHVATRDLGSQVEIRVRDNGTGIGDEVRDKIFEPFFTTKPAGEGTGLGLSLSYDIIVKQHGGQLTVDSRPNDCTEFKISLPRRMAANAGGRG